MNDRFRVYYNADTGKATVDPPHWLFSEAQFIGPPNDVFFELYQQKFRILNSPEMLLVCGPIGLESLEAALGELRALDRRRMQDVVNHVIRKTQARDDAAGQ